MLKHKNRWHPHPPPYETVWVKPITDTLSVQIRRGHGLKRADARLRLGKTRPGQHPADSCCAKLAKSTRPTFAIHSQEITSFLNLCDDRLIRDFLRKDSCCKMTDKYLLAMTFVYFKRARFAIAEYTRKNFFIALYLANTMEEDEEETKYEIFPWTLGRSWSKKIPGFLKQRDELWARMGYRAAVSRHCCEEVMAISPSHPLWQRERREHHSGAQRQYDDRPLSFPLGPSTSPVSCALCNGGSVSDPRTSKENQLFLHPFTRASKKALPRAAKRPPCCAADLLPTAGCSGGPAADSSMDWFLEE